MPNTIQSILTHDKAVLEAALELDYSSARIEVQCLLQAVLQVNRAWLLTYPEQSLNPEQYTRYMALFERRMSGEPIAYLLGEREFYGLIFKVSPATLIPRPDTELLVELALARIPQIPPSPQPSPEALSSILSRERERRQTRRALFNSCGRESLLRVLDMGTGSGAIAISIAHARPGIEVTMVDASQEALDVARENARQLLVQHESAHISTKPLALSEAEGSMRTDLKMRDTEMTVIGNVRLLHSDWFTALHGERFDIIVSNPPYIAADDMHLSQGDVRFEPRSALLSGEDGLEDIRRITAQAIAYLHPGGWLLLEHGYDQAERVRQLLHQSGFSGVFSARDLAGIERVSGGCVATDSVA